MRRRRCRSISHRIGYKLGPVHLTNPRSAYFKRRQFVQGSQRLSEEVRGCRSDQKRDRDPRKSVDGAEFLNHGRLDVCHNCVIKLYPRDSCATFVFARPICIVDRYTWNPRGWQALLDIAPVLELCRYLRCFSGVSWELCRYLLPLSPLFLGLTLFSFISIVWSCSL